MKASITNKFSYFATKTYEPEHESLVLMAFLSSPGSGQPAKMHKLVRGSPASIHKVWMYMRTDQNLDLASGYAIFGIYWRLLGISDKYQNLNHLNKHPKFIFCRDFFCNFGKGP